MNGQFYKEIESEIEPFSLKGLEPVKIRSNYLKSGSVEILNQQLSRFLGKVERG